MPVLHFHLWTVAMQLCSKGAHGGRRTLLQHQGLSVVHVRIDREGSLQAHRDAWEAIAFAVEATL